MNSEIFISLSFEMFTSYPMGSIKIVYLYSTPRQICLYHFDVPTLNIHESVFKGKATDVPTVENTRAIS